MSEIPVRLAVAPHRWPDRGWYAFLGSNINNPGTAEAIGERFAAQTAEYPELNIIGIAQSGVRMVAVPGRQARSNPKDEFAVLWPPYPELPQFQHDAPIAVVDNSIKVHTTLRWTVNYLKKRGIHPDLFIKLLDYGDQDEANDIRKIQELGMQAISLFRTEELLTRRQKVAVGIFGHLPRPSLHRRKPLITVG